MNSFVSLSFISGSVFSQRDVVTRSLSFISCKYLNIGSHVTMYFTVTHLHNSRAF